VLRAESLEKELNKVRKHSAMLQSKIDGAFAQYHNEVQEMQAKSDDLIRKNKSLCQKNKVMPPSACRVLIERSRQKSNMLQGYGDTVLRAESLEKELNKVRKHSAMLQSKLDGAFA
jgi:FtsZ-binding cell division protein ZapB